VDVPRISLHRDPGGIDLHRTPPGLNIERTPPSVRIERRQPQVSYDRTDYEAAVNVRRIEALGEHLHERAVSATAEAIAQISSEGDRLARIESEDGSISQIAKEKLPEDEAELTLSAVPPPVRRTVDPGGVSTEGVPGTLRITARVEPLQISFRRASVTVDMEVPAGVDRTA
jgi:hypothetical protein